MHENFNTGFLIASHDKHFLDSLAQKKTLFAQWRNFRI